MLDVRPLFSLSFQTYPGLAHTQQEKPKLPLHVLSTADQPVILDIGHLDKQINRDYFMAWKNLLSLWINQGKTPFLFVHTTDNRRSPELARHLYQQLAEGIQLPKLPAFAKDSQALLF